MLTRLHHLFAQAKSHQGFRRYFANTSWMFVEQILRMVAGLLVGIWVARYLGPTQFGVFSYAIAFTALFGSIAKLGLDGIVVRELVRDPDRRDLYMGTAFWLKLVGSIAMLIVMAFVVRLTSNDGITNIYIFIIGAGALFQSFEVVDFYFQSKVLSRFVSICKLTQLFISSLLKIYLVVAGADLIWFVLVSLIDQITLAISLFCAYRYQKIGSFYRHFDLATANQLLRDSWPLIISGLVVIIYMRIDQIMIKEILGEREVGVYSAATRISEVWYFMPMLLTNSLFPSIVNARQVSEELYCKRLQKLFELMFLMAFLVAFVLTFFSHFIISTLYGENYIEAAGVFSIHIWAGVFVFLGVGAGKWFLAENLQRLNFYRILGGGVLNILLNLILIPKYGINGAAYATIVSQAFASVFLNFVHKKSRKLFVMQIKSIFVFNLLRR